jgi:hypothetical protein
MLPLTGATVRDLTVVWLMIQDAVQVHCKAMVQVIEDLLRSERRQGKVSANFLDKFLQEVIPTDHEMGIVTECCPARF